MAIDKSMLMIFKEGPHDGVEMKWTIDDDPPPPTHSFWREDGMDFYERKNIRPKDTHINYIYKHVEHMERERDEN